MIVKSPDGKNLLLVCPIICGERYISDDFRIWNREGANVADRAEHCSICGLPVAKPSYMDILRSSGVVVHWDCTQVVVPLELFGAYEESLRPKPDVILGTDGEGRPTAELTVSLDIGHLNDQYNWLLSLATVYQAVEEDDPKARRRAALPDTLEGLMNMLEDIRERIERSESDES